MIQGLLKEAFAYSTLSRIGALFALTSLKRLQKRIDPRRANGGVFLGLNGTVIKSHGSADATGVSAAIKLAFMLADHGFTRKLAARVGAWARMPPRTPPAEGADMSVAARRAARLRPLPAGAGGRERRVREDARHLRRVDPHPHGHRAAALRRRGRADLGPRHRRRAGGAGGRRADRRRHRRVIVATATPDQTFPSAAVKVQSAIGMRGGFAFDLQAVCAGFVFALAQADAMIRGRAPPAGDGDRRRDLLAHPRLHGPRHLRAVRRRRRRADPRGGRGHRQGPGPRHPRHRPAFRRPLRELLYVDGGPSSTGTAGVVRMAGQEVFKHAVVKLAQTGAAALERAGLRPPTSTGWCRTRRTCGS